MDKIISGFHGRHDNDLFITDKGVAYQKDMGNIVKYDEDYFNKCLSYEDQEIALKINEGRIGMVGRHHQGQVLDIGIGSGEFIKKRQFTRGYDINPVAVKWLKESGLYSDYFMEFKAFTLWDVLEHIPDPVVYLRHMRNGSHLFISIPIFGNLSTIRRSKHYRPGEHLYYFTEEGLINWLGKYGFVLLERNDYETQAGREDIISYAFVRQKS